jgi:UDP-N-acetylmuramoylalanine--D-glutamate ligase
MVIKTPQAPWINKHIKLALDNKIPVEVDSSLFFKLCKQPIIGITGTKGKTTTSHLIYHILKKAGKNPVKVGIGQTPVLNRLSTLKKKSVVVFELSSWRLSGLTNAKISPHIGVFTNFFPDHMNYYKSLDAYLRDKKNIFLHQKSTDWFIGNCDDPTIKNFCDKVPGYLVAVSMKSKSDGRSVFTENNKIYLNDGIDARELIGVDEMPLRGKHNINNVMSAVGACFAYGVSNQKIKTGIKSFRSPAHRLELVVEKNGVQFYNDTAATNPQSAMAALKTFKKPIILIAGGTDKKLPYKDFAELILKKVKGVVFLKGTATDKIVMYMKKALNSGEQKISFEIVDSMDKAVELASRGADSGDVVLLSPGASSFGIFANEFDRGNQFKYAVKNI